MSDLELWCERLFFRPADISGGCELRVGIGSAEYGGRVRRHTGIGGPDGVGNVRQPELRPGLYPGQWLYGRGFGGTRLPPTRPPALRRALLRGGAGRGAG